MPHLADAFATHRLRRAVPADLPAVTGLLARAGLPLDGVPTAFATGVVAESGDGTLLGAAAVEPYGRAALLRSVVVDPAARGTGLGTELVCCAEGLACELGAEELFLLTETAVDYFPRLGYVTVPRAGAPAAITASQEFGAACPESAVLMRRHVGA